VPGDKSISHRVMLLGAIGSAPLEASGFLRSEDCLATCRAVEALGARVEESASRTAGSACPPERLRRRMAPTSATPGRESDCLLGFSPGEESMPC
jgi:3-phosphoshikimate 1-carboxyvinyltransferase